MRTRLTSVPTSALRVAARPQPGAVKSAICFIQNRPKPVHATAISAPIAWRLRFHLRQRVCYATPSSNCVSTAMITKRAARTRRRVIVIAGKIYLFFDLQVDPARAERDVSAPSGRDEADANAVLILHRDGRPAAGQRDPGAGSSIIAVEILKRFKMVDVPRSGRPGDSDFA